MVTYTGFGWLCVWGSETCGAAFGLPTPPLQGVDGEDDEEQQAAEADAEQEKGHDFAFHKMKIYTW
jgi:hypothetical protein